MVPTFKPQAQKAQTAQKAWEAHNPKSLEYDWPGFWPRKLARGPKAQPGPCNLYCQGVCPSGILVELSVISSVSYYMISLRI